MEVGFVSIGYPCSQGLLRGAPYFSGGLSQTCKLVYVRLELCVVRSLEASMANTAIIPVQNANATRINAWQSAWKNATPFGFLVIDDFFEEEFAEALLRQYPP